MSLNLVPNPSFEHYPPEFSFLGGQPFEGWETRSTGVDFATAQVSTFWAAYGSQSMLFSTFSSPNAVYSLAVAPRMVVLPGETYRCLVTVNMVSLDAGRISAGLFFNDTFLTDHKVSPEYRSSFITKTGIQTLELLVKAPANAATATFLPIILEAAGVATTGYIDGVAMIPAANNEYFDGDTPGCRWSGAVGNSASEDLEDNVLYQRVLPVFAQDEKYGFFGRYLCDGIMSMLQGLDKIVQDTILHPGWTTILDPVTCPHDWLPWCAQIYGVSLPEGGTDDEWRELIREVPVQKRGSLAQLVLAIQKTLIGTKYVGIQEQAEGHPYRIGVQTVSSETFNVAATEAAAMSQKPGGLKMVYTAAGVAWIEATKKYSAVAATVTWENVKPGDV